MRIFVNVRWLLVLVLVTSCICSTYARRGGGGSRGGSRGSSSRGSSSRGSSSSGSRNTHYERNRGRPSESGSPSAPAPPPKPPVAPKPKVQKYVPSPRPNIPASQPKPSAPEAKQPAQNPNYKEQQPAYNPNYKETNANQASNNPNFRGQNPPANQQPPPYAPRQNPPGYSPAGQPPPNAPGVAPPPYSASGQHPPYNPGGAPPPYSAQGPSYNPSGGVPGANYPRQPGSQGGNYPPPAGGVPGVNYPRQPGSQGGNYPHPPGGNPPGNYPNQPSYGGVPGANYPRQPGGVPGANYPRQQSYPPQTLGGHVYNPQSGAPAPAYMNYGGIPTGSNMYQKPLKKKGFLGSLMGMGGGGNKMGKPPKYYGSYPSPYGGMGKYGGMGGGMGRFGGRGGISGTSLAMYTILPYMAMRGASSMFRPPFGYFPMFLPSPFFHHHHYGYHGGQYGRSYYDVYNNEYVGRCIRPITPKNAKIVCNSTQGEVRCGATCEQDYYFPDNTTYKENKCWHVTGVWRPAKNIEDCKPVCNETCLNGGSCASPGVCGCPPEYRGKHCEYHFLNCDIRKLAGDIKIRWVCTHTKNETKCRVNCKEPNVFESTPPDEYKCTPEGAWTPATIPKCIVPETTTTDWRFRIHGSTFEYATPDLPDYLLKMAHGKSVAEILAPKQETAIEGFNRRGMFAGVFQTPEVKKVNNWDDEIFRTQAR